MIVFQITGQNVTFLQVPYPSSRPCIKEKSVGEEILLCLSLLDVNKMILLNWMGLRIFKT